MQGLLPHKHCLPSHCEAMKQLARNLKLQTDFFPVKTEPTSCAVHHVSGCRTYCGVCAPDVQTTEHSLDEAFTCTHMQGHGDIVRPIALQQLKCLLSCYDARNRGGYPAALPVATAARWYG